MTNKIIVQLIFIIFQLDINHQMLFKDNNNNYNVINKNRFY